VSRGQADNGFEGTDSNWNRHFGLIGFSSLLSEGSVNLSGILDTVSVKFWRLLGLDKSNVLLEEITSQELSTSARGHLLLVHIGSLTVLFLFSLDFRFDHSVFVCETESRSTSSGHHEPMVVNNLLSNSSIVLGVLFVEHNEDQIETG